MHKNCKKNATHATKLSYRRRLNEIRQNMRQKKQNYSQTKTRKISHNYIKIETIFEKIIRDYEMNEKHNNKYFDSNDDFFFV